MEIEPAANGAAVHLPKGLAVFRQLLRIVGRAELGIAVAALCVVVALSVAQALLRYTMSASLWWAQEVAENTVLVGYFFGISYVFKTRQYIVIEFVSSILPMRIQLLLYVIAQLLAFVFTVTILWFVYLFLPTLMNMTTPILKMPAIVNTAPLIVASAMIALTSVYYLAYAIWAIGRRRPGESLYDMEAAGLVLSPWEEEE